MGAFARLTATAIFLVLVGIVIWFDLASEPRANLLPNGHGYPQSRHGRRSWPRTDYPF